MLKTISLILFMSALGAMAGCAGTPADQAAEAPATLGYPDGSAMAPWFFPALGHLF